MKILIVIGYTMETDTDNWLGYIRYNNKLYRTDKPIVCRDETNIFYKVMTYTAITKADIIIAELLDLPNNIIVVNGQEYEFKHIMDNTEDGTQAILIFVLPKFKLNLNSLAVPLTRRIYPSLVAKNLVSVQPMSAPKGFVYALTHNYKGKTK